MQLSKWAGSVALLAGLMAVTLSVSASEPVSIHTLLASAASYHGHMVTIVGTAKSVERWPPVPGGKRCGIRYDAYVFGIEDDSGAIRVEVEGRCGIQGGVAMIHPGDRVLVEGMFLQLPSSNFGSATPLVYALIQGVRSVDQQP